GVREPQSVSFRRGDAVRSAVTICRPVTPGLRGAFAIGRTHGAARHPWGRLICPSIIKEPQPVHHATGLATHLTTGLATLQTPGLAIRLAIQLPIRLTVTQTRGCLAPDCSARD